MPIIIINSKNVLPIIQSVENWKIEQNIIFINLSITLCVQCEVAITIIPRWKGRESAGDGAGA
jgi:hypothetical protein